MRKPNSANQQPIHQHTSSVHYFLLAVMLLTACSIALSGCSKIGLQDYGATDFDPIPQPKSLTERQQRSIEKSLAEQDAQRASAKAVQTAVDESTEEFGDQKKEIVAEAARRAGINNDSEQSNLIRDSAVAQVSFETDLEQNENGDDSVRLRAKKDDFEGVPENVARQDVDFSRANFLRPSSESVSPASTEQAVATEAKPKPFGDAESLRLPLQPMLFNPETRSTLSSYEGTLRPLAPRDQELEADVAIESRTSTTTSGDFKQDLTNIAGSLQPLSPQVSEATIKLKSQQTTGETSVTNSRLLQPIEKQNTEMAALDQPAPPINTEVRTVEASTAPIEVAPPEPIIVSEKIAVVEAEAPDTEDDNQFRGQPVVETTPESDQSFDSTPEETHNSFIPAAVIADAEALADDLKQEFSATTIPTESGDTNEFKVQPVSNTTITSVCRGCGSESCSGCDIDRGEPMFTNNDFAAPATPGGDFVAPMAVPPASIPQVTPEEVAPATPNFGAPVNLDAPPEDDAPIARIAALPVAKETFAPETSVSSVPPVGISTLMDLNAVTWKSRLDEAIELAEARLNRLSQPPASSKVNLRLLKALRSQMEHVENTPAGEESLADSESQYWEHQLEAITAMLETPTGENQAVTDYRRHQAAHETLAHLRNAIAQLESIASLKVSSGQFCTEINGFGQFRTFPSNSFDPGQKTLVYCEVENYTAEENETATGNDFRTRLRGSFAVYDANGKVVQQAEFPSVDDVARKRRRDFYMYMPVTIGDLPTGDYVLHALVEDVYGKKTASLDPPLKFSVK